MSPYFVVVFFSLVNQLFALFKFVLNSISDTHVGFTYFRVVPLVVFYVSTRLQKHSHSKKRKRFCFSLAYSYLCTQIVKR